MSLIMPTISSSLLASSIKIQFIIRVIRATATAANTLTTRAVVVTVYVAQTVMVIRTHVVVITLTVALNTALQLAAVAIY
jgi:hypothetical protein